MTAGMLGRLTGFTGRGMAGTPSIFHRAIWQQTPTLQPTLHRHISIGKINPSSSISVSGLSHGNQPQSSHKPSNSGWSEMTTAQRVIHSGQNIGYGGVVVVGLGILGYAIWTTATELSKTTQAWKVYDASLEHVLDSDAIQRALGIPITAQPGAGPAGSRGSKTLSHSETLSKETGESLMNMRYYVDGPKGRGVVNVQAVWDPAHNYRDETSDMASKGRLGADLLGTSRWSLQVIVVNLSSHHVVVMDRRIHSGQGFIASRMVVWTPPAQTFQAASVTLNTCLYSYL
ncbi:hypothetical protein BSLG_004248 [Batrachochytrium salamandrivorans]|nr:hypothetical protein BSLG_004248 [Batrachochytrium salamandrivorans]